MGLFDNGLKLGTGLAIGVGALILAPTLVPVVASVVKPLAKATIKSTMILFERSREMLAETREVLEDLAAEAKSELMQSQTPPVAQEGLSPAMEEATIPQT